MPLQTGLCIVYRWLISPDGKVGTRIRFQTSMWKSVDGERVPNLRTFEATLCDISTRRQIDEGDRRYGFVLAETPDSAAILKELSNQYEQKRQKVLDEWTDDQEILPLVRGHLAKSPVFHLQTSAEYIFAEGDRVQVFVPSPDKFSISELLGDITRLEILQ